MRPARELQATLDRIAATLSEGVLPARTAGAANSELAQQILQAVYDVAEAAMFGEAAAAHHACATVTELLRRPTLEAHPKSGNAPPSRTSATEAAVGLLLSAVDGMVLEVEDAVLRCMEGEAPAEQRARAHAVSSQALAVIAVLQDLAAGGGIRTPAKRLRGLARRINQMLGDLPPELRDPDPFEPLSETDTVLLNYVDLDVFSARYGYARVPATTIRAVNRAGCGFGDLARHYLREDLPDWCAVALGLDVRQAQLITAGIASINETYRLFSTKGDRIAVHRDAIVMKLLCEDNYCRRQAVRGP